MALEIIGAGCGRTGTLSVCTAAWYDSTMDTIYFTEKMWQFKVLEFTTSFGRKFGDMSRRLIWQRSHNGTMNDRDQAIAHYFVRCTTSGQVLVTKHIKHIHSYYSPNDLYRNLDEERVSLIEAVAVKP